jgi:hypothetical protein
MGNLLEDEPDRFCSMFPLILLRNCLIFQPYPTVTSHGLRGDEFSLAYVTAAADVHVCAYNVREDERQEGIRSRSRDHTAETRVL